MSLLEELGGHRIALGTAGFAFGERSGREAVDAIIAAVESGVRLIDSARAYTRAGEEATAETLLGAALRAVGRDRVLVSTKGGHWRSGDEFPVDGSRAALGAHCRASLRALGTDEIDLYHLHHVDPSVPLEESVLALAELQSSGLVRSIALSNVTAEQLDAARRIAPIAAVQNRLALTSPGDVELTRQCEREGIAFLAYSPLGGVGAQVPAAAEAVAARHGTSMQAVLIAWVLAQSAAVVPVVGATRPRTIRDSVHADAVRLSQDDLAELAGERVH